MNLTAATTQMNRGGSGRAASPPRKRLDGRQVSSIAKPGTRSYSAANHCARLKRECRPRPEARGAQISAGCRNVTCVQGFTMQPWLSARPGIAARSCTTLCGPADVVQQVTQDRPTQWADGVLDLWQDALGGRGARSLNLIRHCGADRVEQHVECGEGQDRDRKTCARACRLREEWTPATVGIIRRAIAARFQP